MFADLTKLFDSQLRIKVIKYFALQPEERFALATVASAFSAARDTVKTELAALVRIGVVDKKQGRTGTTYGWNRDYPRALLLQNFVIDATTPNDRTVAEAFKPLGVYLVVVAGALAEETRGSVDLLVVTKRTQDPRIAKVVKRLESQTAVPIRYSVMEVGEYLRRREGYDRLLRDITDFRHRVVLSRI
jgi:hypothetical protein